jgi:ubiquinone/menaquinone biosynthesis C-methylase UbiE
MSKENINIHDFELELICDYYSTMERQGPGSHEMTMKALSFLPEFSENKEILDIGCGTGAQTFTIAKNTSAKIIGLDMFPQFIEIFNRNMEKSGFQNRVTGIVGDMCNMEFKKNSFDLIWSEGAIYNIGFHKGMMEWHKFLKKDGYIAVTEVAWLRNEKPTEIETFWTDAYPEIDTIPVKLAQMQSSGYLPVAAFVLPENCWLENFYNLHNQAQTLFLSKYADNKIAKELVDYEELGKNMYIKYKDYFSYVFFIGKKI